MNHPFPAQAIREAIREDPKVCELLERWWWGSKMFDDEDHNEWLDFDEYKKFHARLLRLVQMGPLSPKSKFAAEVAAGEDPTALEDFRCDADAEGRVTKETYLFAVFQLCDQWTETVDRDEYVEFLPGQETGATLANLKPLLSRSFPTRFG